MIQNAEEKTDFADNDSEKELISPELLDDSLDFEEEDLDKLPV